MAYFPVSPDSIAVALSCTRGCKIVAPERVVKYEQDIPLVDGIPPWAESRQPSILYDLPVNYANFLIGDFGEVTVTGTGRTKKMHYPAGRVRWYLGAVVFWLHRVVYLPYRFGLLFSWLSRKFIVWSSRIRGTHGRC